MRKEIEEIEEGIEEVEKFAEEIVLNNEPKFYPTDDELTTIFHSLNTLNQVEVLHIIDSFNITVNLNAIKKKRELIEFILFQFRNGILKRELFDELRSQAFNPEIDSTDGFFASFDVDKKTSQKELKKFLEKWNEINDTKEIKLTSFTTEKATFIVSKYTDRYIFDKESMYSFKYNEEKRALAEIYFDKKIIYIQTTNTVIYQSIISIIRGFLQDFLDIKKLIISPPKMGKNLSLTFNEDFTEAFQNKSVNPNTIKLLDLLLELDTSTSFSGFECVNITLDHEDTINRKDSKSKILSQNYGGGDLLENKVVKNLILSNRIIYEVEFTIEYNFQEKDGSSRKHIVRVGMINDRKSSFRIFIKNSDFSMRTVIKKAYSELKNVFISNYGASNLRNEEKIKNLLGIK